MNSSYTPTIVIGLGGTGYQVLTLLKNSLIEENYGQMPENVKLLAFDTQSETRIAKSQQNISDFKSDKTLDPEEFISLGRDLNSYVQDIERSKKSYLQNWVNTRDLSRQPRSSFDLREGAGQNRVIARLALFAEFESIASSKVYYYLKQNLQELQYRNDSRDDIQVCIVCSVAGGTGSSWLIDFPIILRGIAESGYISLTLRAFVVFPEAMPFLDKPDVAEANAFSAWRELDRLMSASSDNPQTFEYPGNIFPLNKIMLEQPIYNHCYLFGEEDTPQENKHAIYPTIADILLMLTDENVSIVVKNREMNLQASFSGEGQSFYSGVGVHSLKSSWYWLKKHIAARYLEKKWYEIFRYKPSSEGAFKWPVTSDYSISKEIYQFCDSCRSQEFSRFIMGVHEISKLNTLKRHNQYDLNQLQHHFRNTDNKISEQWEDVFLKNSLFLSEPPFEKSDVSRNPVILERETHRLQQELFGVELNKNHQKGGLVELHLLTTSNQIYTQLIELLVAFGEELFEPERFAYRETGPF